MSAKFPQPAEPYTSPMTFTAYQVGKFLLICLVVVIWGLWTGLTGRDLQGRRKPTGQEGRRRQD